MSGKWIDRIGHVTLIIDTHTGNQDADGNCSQRARPLGAVNCRYSMLALSLCVSTLYVYVKNPCPTAFQVLRLPAFFVEDACQAHSRKAASQA
jgi:hypothetical protein